MTYAKVVEKVLNDHPEIYTQYEKEVAANSYYTIPSTALVKPEDTSLKFMTKSKKKQKAPGDDDDYEPDDDEDDLQRARTRRKA
jgi:hypothetical protein